MDITEFAMRAVQWSVVLLVFCVGLFILYLLVLYVIDITQTQHTIRRNYPIVGRMRYFFEHMGEFFRQYFFALDREELPFNRAERSWAYRAAKKVDSTIAFGSTRPLNREGDIIFLNCAFPTLSEDATEPGNITFGPDCPNPFTSNSIINISGMSYGAISKPAVLALSKGAAAAGIWLNTGEGGLSPYHLRGGANIVFQIGTANYGVRDKDGKLSDEKLEKIAGHDQVKMFELKLSQGAKPGKGGMLPGAKVTKEIAEIRGIEPGQDSISPNRHVDIKSVDDLIDKINHIRKVTKKPVGFKLVIGNIDFIDNFLKQILQRGLESAPDFITIDSADGGTGAAPQPLMDYVGLPLQESLPQVVDLLVKYGLRERIKIIASGKLMVPSRVAWAIAVGADTVVSARGFMFALGCIQALQCNKNTCPTGITTHDKQLQRGLVPAHKAVRVANYAKQLQYEVGMIAHSCGVADVRKLRRKHVNIIQADGPSRSLAEIYPEANQSS